MKLCSVFQEEAGYHFARLFSINCMVLPKHKPLSNIPWTDFLQPLLVPVIARKRESSFSFDLPCIVVYCA